MRKAMSPELKVTLNKKNTPRVRKAAEALPTTPPKLVNRIIEDHFSRAERNGRNAK